MDIRVQRPNEADKPLKPGTRVIDVYDEMGGSLLILGAPGSGKTTLLLELARDLLNRAEQDESHPISVVFPLSTWAEQRFPLEAWLVDELRKQYGVPKKIGQAWVDADRILLLLDGLDEVQNEYRAGCIVSVNAFRQDHGLLPLVICSREKDYKDIGTQLQLQSAIVVQPLTREQAEFYLRRGGEDFAAVRQALREELTLWELLDTPLMLTLCDHDENSLLTRMELLLNRFPEESPESTTPLPEGGYPVHQVQMKRYSNQKGSWASSNKIFSRKK